MRTSRAVEESNRAWLKGWRVAVLLALIFGEVATPTGDAISMLMLAIPTSGLYFAAVGVTLRRDHRVAKQATADDDENIVSES